MELTLIVAKPAALLLGIEDELISRLESKGLRIIAQKKLDFSSFAHDTEQLEQAGKHFLSDGESLLLVAEGTEAVEKGKEVFFSLWPRNEIQPPNMRRMENSLLHASFGKEVARYEVLRFFTSEELAKGK